MAEILLLAFLFLVAGVIAVPIASRLGLGSVLGYLLAGIAISPLLKRLHVDVVSIQHFAEFGVVMMLFLVGLELEPRLLWRMRNKLLGLGGLQVGVTAAIVMGVAMALGQPWNVAILRPSSGRSTALPVRIAGVPPRCGRSLPTAPPAPGSRRLSPRPTVLRAWRCRWCARPVEPPTACCSIPGASSSIGCVRAAACWTRSTSSPGTITGAKPRSSICRSPGDGRISRGSRRNWERRRDLLPRSGV